MEASNYDNPFDQAFIVHDRYGEEVAVPLLDVATYVHNGIVQTIILGSQIGASLAVLIVLLILTKAEKRRLPVFWLNSLTLLFSVISNILLCMFYTNSWNTPYSFFTDDYSFVTPGAKATSIAGVTFQLLVLTCLEASLVLQVHVVSVTLDSWKRTSLIVVSTLIALLAVGFRIAQSVDNITYNVLASQYNYSTVWLVQARDVTLAVSICFFSLVFCAKLGLSLIQRRKMGMTRFGPMQIIFIGGAQTLIVPATFAILQFLLPKTRINSLVLTVTAISLPLTSLWAAAATSTVPRPDRVDREAAGAAIRSPDAHRGLIGFSTTAVTSGGSSSGGSGQKGTLGSSVMGKGGYYLDDEDEDEGDHVGGAGGVRGEQEKGLDGRGSAARGVGIGMVTTVVGGKGGQGRATPDLEVGRVRDWEMQDLGRGGRV